MAKELDQPLISVQSLEFAGVIFHYLRRDVQATRELAETCITLATEHGRPVWLAAATFFYNWALIARVPATSVENNVEGPGKIEAGLAQMHQNLADYQATGVKFASPLFLTALAEACGNAGQIEEGLALLTEALVAANQSGERIYEAEIYRLKGDLLLKADVERRRASSESPEDCFLQAVRIARAQQAKSLELRATMSLCHWWHRQGKREQAQQRLDEIYGWFSEGFDTPDLREAQKLLTTLQVS
jgi:predicted ATPase